MPSMIELMRASSVPANVMRTASKGALNVPAAEMIEILVFLSGHSLFGEAARMTLAGWDETSSIAAAGDPHTATDVLDYFMSPENRRPRLLPALIENPSVSEAKLMELSQTPSREIVDIMLRSPRVRASPNLLHALASNVHLSAEESAQVKSRLAELGESAEVSHSTAGMSAEEKTQYEIDHAAEIAAEEGKPFELVGISRSPEGLPKVEEVFADVTASSPAAAGAPATESSAAKAPAATAVPAERERISTLTKLARMSVGERVQAAMKGSKDDRFILIRDGSKVVSSAVLESPKLSDSEVETFASMKNVQESVLRGIAGKRKFMKNYSVIRQLVNNPRCPLDLSLSLMKNLLVADLKVVSMNKNVPESLRKLALKNYTDKTVKK